MKRRIYLIPLLIALLLGGWLLAGLLHPQPAVAQEIDLDALLSRSAVRGYLTGLQVSPSGVLVNYYLADNATGHDAARALQFESFEITGQEQTGDGAYRITAALSPGSTTLTIDVNKIDNRWRITAVTIGQAAPAEIETDTPATTAAATPAATTTPAAASPAPTAATPAPVVTSEPVGSGTVIAAMLNLRAGPGIAYPVVDVLASGTAFDILGLNATREFYQVAQNGLIVGWLSTRTDLVSATTNVNDPNLPVIPAPPLNSTGNTTPAAPVDTDNATSQTTTTRPSGPPLGIDGTLILQPYSGGPIYQLTAGGELRYLTNGIDPALSPDGSQLAFTRWEDGDYGTLFLRDMASGQERAIIGRVREMKSPTWSPDGSRIAVTLQNGGRREEEEDCVDYGEQIPGNAVDLKFKEDEICFRRLANAFWQLRQINLADGSFEDLPSEPYSKAPTWDPVNAWRIVFASGAGLLQLDLNRGEYFDFTGNLSDRGPVFSPDGSKVAVSYHQDTRWEVYTIDTATGERARLTEPSFLLDKPYNSAAPAFSPDSSQIAYVTDRNGQWEFWIMNADGSNQRPLLPPELAAQLEKVQYNGVDERLITWSK